jgi:hypothetical protein
MTTGMRLKRPLIWVGLVVLVAFSGLCTIFVSVATAAQAWQEHARAQWPEVTAHVDKCDLLRTSTNGGHRIYIRCRLSYTVGTELKVTIIDSARVAAPEVWQYPRNQIAPLEEWVAEHPQGTPIVVQYDPANRTKVVLLAANTPFVGVQTPNNWKLLGASAGSFLILLTIARITCPRSPWQSGHSSMSANT